MFNYFCVFRPLSVTPLCNVVNPVYLAAARDSETAALRIDDVHLFVRLSVCLSVAKMQKNAIFSKTKQVEAAMSIDDLQEVM